MPCGKPQAAHFAHLVALLQWLPGRAHFTGLEHYGAHPCARLAVAALGAVPPRSRWELLVLDASFVSKSGRGTWGAGMARAVRWGLEVMLLAAVDVEEGGAYPLCARQSPGAVRSRRQACGAATGQETAVDTALVLLLDLHAVGRLRKDAVLRFSYTGPHEWRPGCRRPCDGRFNRRDLSRMACTTTADGDVDLYHRVLYGKAWPCQLQVVYFLPRGADPQTTAGVLLYSTDLAPARHFRLYGARFPIEFAFRDAKQHLALNDGQARPQAKLHFHFSIVLAAWSWACRRAQLQAERPLGPFSLHRLKQHNFEAEIRQRFAARLAAGPNAANSEAGRCRIPLERVWLRALPLAQGRPLNTTPQPAWQYASGFKMCPSHRGLLMVPN